MAVAWKSTLRKKAKNFEWFIEDVEHVLKSVGENLRPEFQEYTYEDGQQRELFVLDGTILVYIRGAGYNIPVCVLLQEDHPFVAPLVYVRPTNTMVLHPSKHLDTSGKVYHPYLHNWSCESSDIASLLQIVCSTFSDFPPVFAKRTSNGNSNNRVTEPQGSASLRQTEVQGDCIICMEKKSDSVLIPCGHLGFCLRCANELKRTTTVCPVCRKNIDQVLRVYQP
ncbi:tumor susceptibility gene 101 protein-like [Montipora capricornis]|uniref:tumor susceptibility gene 101 protein-like n=1 Tax=Montipora capricornis TaxID=246305 RepID=UPI0035F18C81